MNKKPLSVKLGNTIGKIFATIKDRNTCKQKIMTRPVLTNLEYLSIVEAKNTINQWYQEGTFPIKHINKSLDTAREAYARRSEMRIEWSESPEGQEILAKAKKYKIPYDPESFSWTILENQVEEYENLLKEAEEYDLDTSPYFFAYNPVPLKGAIEEAELQTYKKIRQDRYIWTPIRL